MSRNLTTFLLYLFLEKCPEIRKERNKRTCLKLYERFNRLSRKLLFDEKGHLKLPAPREWRRFFDKLWRLRVPDFCLRTVIFGNKREIKTCVDLSLELVKRGAPNGALEGVGIVSEKEYPGLPKGREYFLFLRKRPVKVGIGRNWVYGEREVFIPISDCSNERVLSG